MVSINIPKQRPQEEMPAARRLFAMAAPIAGGAMGGPLGAMAGQMVGSRLMGGSAQEAMVSGLDKGASSALSRRLDQKKQDPMVALREGLDAAVELPDSIRQEYTAPILKAFQLGSAGLSMPKIGSSYGGKR